MDNDSKFKHKLVNIYRHWRFKIQNRGRKIHYYEEGNDLLFKELNDAIENKRPYLVGRFGAVEARTINCYLKGKKYPNYLKERLSNCAGVFNHSNKEIDEFAKVYSSSFYNVDILVTWSVKACGWLNRKLCNNAKSINFYAIEPWFYKNPWTRALENKRVLIIHPFIETMKKQYEKRGGVI